MRRNFTVWILLLTGLLGAGGCELADLGDPIVVSNVAREFNIDMWEALAPGGRALQLRITTLKEEPCSNASIAFEQSRVGNKISVILKDIVEPGDCQIGPAPARATADLGPLSSGYYELTIGLKGTVVNRGQLTVLGNRYSLDMRTTEGFLLLHRELLRVPENTIWGYIGYDNAAGSEPAGRFIQELKAASLQRAFTDGYYGYFQIAGQGSTVTLLERPSSSHFQPLIFHYEGATGSLREMIDRYQSEPDQALDIRLYTANGEILD